MKTEVIHARIEPALKQSAEKIFRKLGMTTTEAISIFMRRVIMEKGIPFDVKIPNKKTRKAIADVKAGKYIEYNSVKEVMDDLNR
jgi:DNA-damage-inducible protein J